MSNKLVPRKTVIVYEDPLTRKVEEGQAFVITENADDPNVDGNVMCHVKFRGREEPIVFRWVHISELERIGYR